jgi:hypothetical protein
MIEVMGRVPGRLCLKILRSAKRIGKSGDPDGGRWVRAYRTGMVFREVSGDRFRILEK